MAGAVDVHQHLWPEPLIDLLRARSRPPYLRDWLLHTVGEPAYAVGPADHDPELRRAADRKAGIDLACLSLSAPLGLESLPLAEATPLLDAWHDGLAALPAHFAGWASVHRRLPDLAGLRSHLASPRMVGVQLPATDLATPAAWASVADVLAIAQEADRPVLVHPGPVPASSGSEDLPGWWSPVVPYTAQLTAAWWSWQAWRGRDQLPTLRVVFAAGAGLGPLHHERQIERGGQQSPIDPLLFVDTSGYGPRAWDALMRVLGIDALVLGSDRPYGSPVRELFGDAATHAVRVTNPARLLGRPGSELRPEPVSGPVDGPASDDVVDRGGGTTWPFAS